MDVSSLLQSPSGASSSLRRGDKDLAASLCAVDEGGISAGSRLRAVRRTPHFAALQPPLQRGHIPEGQQNQRLIPQKPRRSPGPSATRGGCSLPIPPSSQSPAAKCGPFFGRIPFAPDCHEARSAQVCTPLRKAQPGKPHPHPTQRKPGTRDPTLTSAYGNRCDALPLPQHRRGSVPARHFAASRLPRAGGGVSPTVLVLLLPAIPPRGCCTCREAAQLTPAGAGDDDF